MNFENINVVMKNSSDVPKGKDIYYKCLKCGDVIFSRSKVNVSCKCRNMFIDVGYLRLTVEEFSKFQVLKKI